MKPRIVYSKHYRPHRSLADRINLPMLAVAAWSAFALLSVHAMGKSQVLTDADRAEFDALHARVMAEKSPAQQAMQIYHLTDRDLARPVVLWREK